jgi:4'-phosphopantetheinyl transferase
MQQHDPALALDLSNLHWLTEDEFSRYESITSVNRKWQFLAGHYLIRAMAARYYENSHADWIYFVGADKQRHLKCHLAGIPELFVSLSHSGEWIAASVSAYPIGIDIETYAKQRDYMAIARHAFSEAETGILKSLAPGELQRQFYLYWTLKECVAKQYGDGLQFEVSRANSFISVGAMASASIVSWQCSDYVLSISSKPDIAIDISGLCDNAEKGFWQNIPVIL